MKLFIKYIVSSFLVFTVVAGQAQDSLQVELKTDSTILQKTKQPLTIIPALDYGKLATTAIHWDTKYEFNLSVVVFNHIRINADYGHGELEPKNAIENGKYISTGDYYRAGLDYQFEIATKTFLSFGGMYASSTFKDEGQVDIPSEIWPSLSESFARQNFNAQWAEFVITTEKVVANREQGPLAHLYVGAKFRLRFLINRPRPENFDVYAIPGYGRTFNNVVPAANLFVAYRIEL